MNNLTLNQIIALGKGKMKRIIDTVVRLLFLMVLGCTILSCGDHDIIIPEKVVHLTDPVDYIGDITQYNLTPPTDCFIVFDSSRYSMKIFDSVPIYHRESSKHWLPQFCYETGDSIPYINALYDTTYLVVDQKDVSYWQGSIDVRDSCTDDKKLAYVYVFEGVLNQG